jgi:hypothetical protein
MKQMEWGTLFSGEAKRFMASSSCSTTIGKDETRHGHQIPLKKLQSG